MQIRKEKRWRTGERGIKYKRLSIQEKTSKEVSREIYRTIQD